METEKKILKLLQKDARLSSTSLAEMLAISKEEVDSIIKKYEDQNVIRGYYALINEGNLPKRRVRALIEVSVEPERDRGFDRIARNLSKFSEVSDVLLISGNFDLLLIVVGDTLNEVADFVSRKLAPLDGVQSTRTHFILKKYKEAGFQLEDDEEYERLKITP